MRNERRKRMPNWAIGLILIVVVAVASVYAYTKELPWADKHEVEAVFETAANIRTDSPVRIAGVNVGKVTSVEHLAADDDELAEAAGDDEATEGAPTQATVVKMELDESALPLHTDATMKLRPRLFLEGNLFVDLKPGSPNAPEAEEGFVFPAGQTSAAVSLDQVLTTLQADVRSNLQVLLDEFGSALDKHGGSEGMRELFRSSPGAFRYTSQVNEALLGTQPRDLSDLVVNLDSMVEAFARNKGELQDLVTNLNTVLASFAAESDALQEGIALLPEVLREGEPALASLNASFPAVRAFSREALPGVRSTPAMLDATTPFLEQLRRLVSREELRGLTADLRPAVPELARLTRATIPFLHEARRLSSCFNEVIIPWSNSTVPDPETPPTGRVFEELAFGLTGLSGETRSGDANGPYFRVLAAGGQNTVVLPDPIQGLTNPSVGSAPLPILGARPAIESSAKTPFRPDVPCERQDPPNLNSGQAVGPPDQTRASGLGLDLNGDLRKRLTALGAPLNRAIDLLGLNGKRKQRGEKLYANTLADLTRTIADGYGLGKYLGGDSK